MNASKIIHNLFDINSSRVKTTIILLSIIYLLIIFKIVLSRFNTTDTIPQLKTINTEVLKTLGTFTVRVRTGMFIKKFHIFDVNKNQFSVDSVIWFEFNGDEITLETIDKFGIDNGKITYKSPPDIKIEGDKIFAKYNVLFDLKTDLTFYKFPLEDHRLPILLSNDFVTPDEMFYTVDGSSFQIQSGISPAGWSFSDTSVDAGFFPIQLDEQDKTKKAESPIALFVLNFVKASARKALIIFMPLFAVVFLAMLAYVMNASNIVGKFSLSITAVTALLGYRFVIEQMMPQVGYFTTTDAIYLFLLIFAFTSFSTQLLLTRHYMVIKENASENLQNLISKLETINSIIFVIMSLLLIGVTTYIILM